jgi:hypothetical protein
MPSPSKLSPKFFDEYDYDDHEAQRFTELARERAQLVHRFLSILDNGSLSRANR